VCEDLPVQWVKSWIR